MNVLFRCGFALAAAMAMTMTARAGELTVPPGFKAELVRFSQGDEGSWICMTVDAKGRFIISPQGGTGNLLRMTITPEGTVEKVEKIRQPVGSAMGLLCAFDSLYVNGNGPEGYGLYRLPELAGEDGYGPPKLLKKWEGGANGEHGGHAVVLGPDRNLYVVCGNATELPRDAAADSPCRNYAEDLLLPRDEDSLGFSVGQKPPEGFLLRADENGTKWELVCEGMRNTYDFAFNADGEMFGFDSDAECDWGLPWYRPTRICHLVSGGDYGFREGTGKWPKYYPDSVPSTVDVGIGSPTGVKFGTDSHFPERYRSALFALDWSYGRIMAVHLTPRGASYEATYETFLKGKPLNVTDIEFGKDGAMYFITGGRGTQAGLYRVTYTGPETGGGGPGLRELKSAARARALRHELERRQGKRDATAVDFAWPQLNSDDRFLRYAARVAIESQPVSEWQERALKESRVNAGINGLLALARCGGRETQADLLRALGRFPLAKLGEEQQLEKLRVMELSFIRQGRPGPETARRAAEELDPNYPAKSRRVNRELCELLVYLQAPDAIEKTLALLDAAPTQEQQIDYVFRLRTLKTGWTMEQHKHYFRWFDQQRDVEKGGPIFPGGPGYYEWSKRKGAQPQREPEMVKWFAEADREYGDGCSFPQYLVNIRQEAEATLSPTERAEMEANRAGQSAEPAKPAPAAARKFVKDWKMADLEPALGQLGGGRSFDRGREVFAAAQCAQCHRFGNSGGAVGPDLTAVSSRYGHWDILDSIIEPSRVVSEQYQNITITRKDGEEITGRIAAENAEKVVVMINPLAPMKVEVRTADIEKRAASKISPMPEGLVNTFTREEILDLIAYLESGGKETAAAFRKP